MASCLQVSHKPAANQGTCRSHFAALVVKTCAFAHAFAIVYGEYGKVWFPIYNSLTN